MSILKKIKYLFKILSNTKFEFKFPQESKILIYDGTRTDKIILFLKNYKLKILYIRWEVLNIPCFFLALTKGKDFMINYIDLFIKYTKPKLIITFCDNDFRFLNLSKRHLGIKTLFLQNGWRSNHLDIFEEFILNNKNISNYHVDYQLVFGQAIEHEYKKYLSGNTFNFGSFLNNYLKKKYSSHKNILAYISQYETSFEKQKFKFKKKIVNFDNFFRKCDFLIINYLQYYAKKNNKNFYIIPRSNKNNYLFRKREKEYF